MEKLVLRGIMYGADKIPDSWIEKVPGGYYKGPQDKQSKGNDKDDKRRDKREKSRRRRHSDEYEERRPRNEESYDSDRPERRRRDADRSSYDGGDSNDSVDEERQRRRARRSTINDADRYGYNDGFSRRDSTRRSYAPNDRYESSPHESQGSSQYADPYFDHAAKRNSAAAVAAGVGTAAAMAQQSQRHVSSAPPMVPAAFPAQAPVAASYVPYSNISGANPAQTPSGRQMFSPPLANSVSSVQANSMNQVTPVVSPPNTYGYSPPNTSYDSRRVSDSFHTANDRQQDPYLSSRSHSPSFETAGSQPRRARSERRPNRDKERFQGKFTFRASIWGREYSDCVRGHDS